MSQARNGFVREEGGSPFLIERPIQYIKEEISSPPFKFMIMEEVIDVPYMGMFVRYNYTLIYDEKVLERFTSLEILPTTEIEEQFKQSIEKWFKEQLEGGNKKG